MKAENNPYFKNHYKPSPLWKVVLMCFALPFLYIYSLVLKLLLLIFNILFGGHKGN
jgi:hypothetical protein